MAMVVEEDSLVWELEVSLCSISYPNRFSVCNLTSESHDEWLKSSYQVKSSRNPATLEVLKLVPAVIGSYLKC